MATKANWADTARRAAEDIWAELDNYSTDDGERMVYLIKNAHADLCASYKKMVELLKVVARVEHPINSNAHLKAREILREIGEMA